MGLNHVGDSSKCNGTEFCHCEKLDLARWKSDTGLSVTNSTGSKLASADRDTQSVNNLISAFHLPPKNGAKCAGGFEDFEIFVVCCLVRSGDAR